MCCHHCPSSPLHPQVLFVSLFFGLTFFRLDASADQQAVLSTLGNTFTAGVFLAIVCMQTTLPQVRHEGRRLQTTR